jgi:prevent-host-death family protein
MGTYSVAEAKNQLSRLIDEAQAGEQVTITRHGKRAVNIIPVQPAPRPMTKEDLDRLETQRAKLPRLSKSGAELVREMRDEDWSKV